MVTREETLTPILLETSFKLEKIITMDDDKWINTDKRSGKLLLRFRVKGFDKQFYISSGLKDSETNRNILRARKEIIERDIALGRFDSTLNSYQFGSVNLSSTIQVSNTKKICELWALFTEFKSTMLEETTIKGSYTSIARYINRFPIQDLNRASEIRDWILRHTTQYMAWLLLVRLSQCCEWAKECNLISGNPFQKLKIPKPKRKSTDCEDYRAFTLEQRDLIINAFACDERHSHYTPLIKLLFFTGCRPGEAFALTWGDISSDCCRISITKSRNLHKILKGTKNGKKRIFPAVQGSKLQNLLLDIRPYNPAPNDLVFRSKFGNQMTGAILNNVWNRSAVVNNGCLTYYPGVVRQLATTKRISYYLKPYATRHTFATWAIASGVTPEKVALWIGDEVETVLKYYCHPNVVEAECPDF